jgi:hypothetical protein
MERVARFRVGGADYVFEMRTIEPTAEVGGGGSIDPGELNIVGDRIRLLLQSVEPDVRLVIESDDPLDAVHIDVERFLDAFRDEGRGPGHDEITIDPATWGIRPTNP